jgi:hypothetical protein
VVDPSELDESDLDVDWDGLRENLKLSPYERYLKHQRALASVLSLQDAARAAGLIPFDDET